MPIPEDDDKPPYWYDDGEQGSKDKKEWILGMMKWSRQYRREYAKLYFKIKTKKIYTEEDIEIFDCMRKKHPVVKGTHYHKDKANAVKGLNIIDKVIILKFD
mgnify:CR=1 FL=1